MRTDSPYLPLLPPRDFATETRARLDRLTEELATGRQFDTGRALSSDFSSFSRVAHDLRTLQTREDALSRATIWMDVAQTSLGAIDDIGTRLSEALTSGLNAPGTNSILNLGAVGDGALADIVNTMARTDAGRAIFGNGDATGSPPFDLAVLQAETTALAQSATDVDSLLRAFDDYFAPGGAVETGALTAYPADSVRFPLGSGESLSVSVAAGDEALRDAVKQAALVAALPDVGFALTAADKRTLSLDLPRRSVAAGASLASLRGGLGSVEARASLLSERLSDERAQLESRRTDAVGTDPFEVANRLQSEMSRLETIYAVTARRSRLRLTDYLR